MAVTLQVTAPVQTVVDTVEDLDSINYSSRNHNEEIKNYPAFIVDNFEATFEKKASYHQIYNVLLTLDCYLYADAGWTNAEFDTLLDEVVSAIAGISGWMDISITDLIGFQGNYGGKEVRIYYFRITKLKRDST